MKNIYFKDKSGLRIIQVPQKEFLELIDNKDSKSYIEKELNTKVLSAILGVVK